jgi:hypothetical protein
MTPAVLRHAGVPTVAQFAGAPGPAIVIDTETGTQYWLAAGDVVTEIAGGGGSGATDHSALAGLADDDHTQYHNNTRGDARYSQLGHTHAYLSGVSGTATITVPYTGAYEWSETVAASGVTGSQRVIVSLAPHADSDENSAEMLDISAMEATAGTDQISFTASFLSKTAGPIKINYMAI